jgi:hypothetical protein
MTPQPQRRCAAAAEQTSLEAAHADVLRTLSLEDATSQSSALQRQQNQAAFAAALSKSITGAPFVTEGFSPVYDLILQAAPPMALTPQGVQEGFEKVPPRATCTYTNASAAQTLARMVPAPHPASSLPAQ